MISLAPSHDVWLAILDWMNDDDRPQLKECNLVCRSWHAHLRPQLMANILFREDHHPLTSADDMQVLHQNSHLVRCLRIEDWHPSEWLSGSTGTTNPEMVVPISPPFGALLKLELYTIAFSTFGELYACISLISSTLEHLVIVQCTCDDASAMKMLLNDKNGSGIEDDASTHGTITDDSDSGSDVYRPRANGLALTKVEIDSDRMGHFANLMWYWFTLSPTLSTVRFLRVCLEMFDEYDLSALFAMLNRSECRADELNLTLVNVQGWMYPKIPSSLSSQTLTNLSLIGYHRGARIRALAILNDSILLSLSSLRILVEADHHDDIGLGAYRDWYKHYPSLKSVHFVVTAWSCEPRLDWASTVQKTINTSDFLDYCARLRILSLDAHECIYHEMVTGRSKPDYTWTSKEV